MDLERRTSPALLSYDGIQYQYMAPGVFTYDQLEYIQQNLRIVSGLYGLLQPFDGVVPHRLEMQARLQTDFCRNLYDFWGDSLARQLEREKGYVLKEDAGRGYRCVSPVFAQLEGRKLAEKGVYVKMARGEMVRFLAETNAKTPEQMQGFHALGYQYRQELSQPDKPAFVKG